MYVARDPPIAIADRHHCGAVAWHRTNAIGQRLAAIPGIGPIATAIAATVAEPGEFHRGRQFAAWRGRVPRQNSTGGKTRLCGIGKRGDSYLRRLRVTGGHAALRRAKAAKADPWPIGLRGRRPRLVVAGALANKTARLAWAMKTKPDSCRFAAAAA